MGIRQHVEEMDLSLAEVHPTIQPTPHRGWDWVAYFEPEGARGFGATREQALADLKINLES